MVEAAFASSAYQDSLWLSLARAAEQLFAYHKGKAPGVSGDLEVQPDHSGVIMTQGRSYSVSGITIMRSAVVKSILSDRQPLEGNELETMLQQCLLEVGCCLIDCYVSQMAILQISMELKRICHQEEEWRWQQPQKAGREQGISSSSGSRGANPQADAAAAADESEISSLDAMVPCLLVRLPEQRLDLQQEQDGGQQQQQRGGSGSGGGGEAGQQVKKQQVTPPGGLAGASAGAANTTGEGTSAAGGSAGGFRTALLNTSALINGSALRLEQLQLIVEVLLLVWKTQGELLPIDELVNHSSPAFVQSPLLLLLLLLLDHTAAEVKAQLLQSRGQLLFQLLYQVLIGRPDQFLGRELGKFGWKKVCGVEVGPDYGIQCPLVPWEVMPIAGEPAGAMGLRDEVDVRQVAGSEERLVLSGAEAVNLLLQKLFFRPVGWEALTADGITPGVDMCCSLGE